MTYTQQIIDVGTTANDGTGDPLRVAFEKVNNNFTSVFSTFVNTSNSYTYGNVTNQLIFECPSNTFTLGQFYIRSNNSITSDSQDIQLYAQLSNDGTTVKFTGYGSTFFGNAVASYDMTIAGGNVKILCTPLVNNVTTLFHFVSSQIMWVGDNPPGLDLALDGYENSVLSTEQAVPISTDQGQ